MGQSFKDSDRYASIFADPQGEGDARPTAFQIIKDNGLVGKLNDKVVFLTGGSNGIGIDEVKNLARTGAQVFFTSRDIAKGKKVQEKLLSELKSEGVVEEPRIEVIQMDLDSLDSIQAGAEEFKSKSDKLNILVNNAGEQIQLVDWIRC
jgi:NAD(P)-dependent dehydrogenase (short-subunit alcohol dehydrogenase family)